MPFELIPLIAHAIEAAILGGAIGGSIAGWCANNPDASGCIRKRDILEIDSVPRMRIARQAATGPCGVPQYNFDQCNTALQSQHATSSQPSSGVAQFDNVPPECMDLSTVLTGTCTGSGAAPIVCGSACLQYTGLSDADFATLSNALTGKS